MPDLMGLLQMMAFVGARLARESAASVCLTDRVIPLRGQAWLQRDDALFYIIPLTIRSCSIRSF